MLTQDVTKELENVLTTLQQQGKEPTVALVKARLSTSIPMAALIAAIKSWKNANRVPKVEVAVKTSTDADRITQLEQTIAQLAKRIEQLEQQINGSAQ
ncbi:hypothetical protein [Vibrio ziniensis]|uniref:KfrA N-terminal DNA-binding domain-containing protein n=1 Tax=Vibrio ziniensis TaxID=2711221 RepID=A0A6G7CGC5_9VIBR|nr:hypothetical protein [Vibrio ziniensis]QIH41139.1 hypothetical protein G5S32_03675 [Vibrio ziniensis]